MSIRAACSVCSVTAGILAVALSGCASDDGETDGDADSATAVVVVPNTILGELVDRVACVEPVEVVIAASDDDRGATGDDTGAALELTLDDTLRRDDRLVLPVSAAGDAIPTPRGVDPWVWTDPIRYQQVAEAVAGALVTETDLDPELLDRCIARLDSQMTTLDEELFAELAVLDGDARVLDIDPPGTVYFATRYEFTPSQEPVAADAAAIVSVDGLGNAEDYETLMRSIVADVIATLG